MLERSERFYERYGWWSVVIARYIPWVRTFVPPIAGTVKMNYYKFLSANALGAFLWGVGITLAGYYSGSIPWVKDVSYALAGFLILLSLYLAYSDFKKINNISIILNGAWLKSRKVITAYIYKKYLAFYFLKINVTRLFAVKKNSYSDFGEDLIVEKLMKSEMGSYVDIGAGHPVIGSNTFYFYQKGWSGVTVEPIKNLYLMHKLRRRKDMQFNKLLSENHGTTKFYSFIPTQYSTMSEKRVLELKELGITHRKIYFLSSVSINTILKSINNSNYFLSIDVEGFDYEVIKSIQWYKIVKPKVIVFETDAENFLLIDRILTINNYMFVIKTEKNCIYLLKT